MSSILDAVNKDAERAGKAPLGSDAAGGESGGSNSPRPRRVLPAVVVVLVGLTVGALAARMFGGPEDEPESLLTDKVAARSAVSQRAADGAAGNARDVRDVKDAKKGRRRGTEPAAAVAGDGGAAGGDHRAQAAGSHKKGKAPKQKHRAGGKAAKGALAAKGSEPAAEPAVAAAPPAAAPVVKPGALTPAPTVVAALPAAAAPAGSPEAAAVKIQPPAVVGTPPSPGLAAPQVPQVPPFEGAAPPVAAPPAAPPVAAPPVAEAAVEAPPVAEAANEATPPQEPAAVVDDTVVEIPLSELADVEAVASEKPPGSPEVVLMFIMWARDPQERMASIRVGSGSITIIHEGQFLEGMQVSSIRADAVDFLWSGSTFRVHVRPF